MSRGAKAIAVALLAGSALAPGPAASAVSPFPDVPPWHWAHDGVQKVQDAGIMIGYPSTPTELIENAIQQVYDAFVHASTPGAQAWVERFTYNRPADWPAPLRRSQAAAFTLIPGFVLMPVNGTTAATSFTARVTTRDGRATSSSIQVQLRMNGEDWQVDYAMLARGSPLFR